MAVEAGAVLVPDLRRLSRNRLMVTEEMAGLAQTGWAGVEHHRLIGAVRLMAGPAVLANRSMLEEIGPALVGVAFIALVVRCQGRDGSFRHGPVWIVAADAGHQAFK